VPVFLVETYLVFANAGVRAARERRASTAAAELTHEGTPVRFAGSIHIPDDELCFFKFDAESDRTAALAARRAGLEPLRVVEAVVADVDDRPTNPNPTNQGTPK
jgi:hypothetical protein